MNQTPQLDNRNNSSHEPLVAPQTEYQKAEKNLSDRILAYAFAASVLINIGCMVWVSHSDLFGKGSMIPPMKETQIKVFKRPLPPKPKKQIKPPPPPPKQPKPLPKPTPHIVHPHPSPPQPHRTHVSVHTTQSKVATNTITVPDVPRSTEPTAPAVPTYEAPTPPSPVTQPTPEAPPAPVYHAPPAPPAPAYHAPPAPPTHPQGWVPIDTQEASYPDGLGSDVSADGIDAGTITNSKVVISFTIDEHGNFRNVRVRESSGNSELDNRFRDAVARGRGTPAIQDHIPRDQPESITFPVGG